MGKIGSLNNAYYSSDFWKVSTITAAGRPDNQSLATKRSKLENPS
jgi:hypothetical protein